MCAETGVQQDVYVNEVRERIHVWKEGYDHEKAGV